MIRWRNQALGGVNHELHMFKRMMRRLNHELRLFDGMMRRLNHALRRPRCSGIPSLMGPLIL
jgi:hypothetical protein